MNEIHYTVKELALWRWSPKTIRKLFAKDPNVLKLQGGGVLIGKRSYVTLSIPESVALRVYQRLEQQPLPTQGPRRHPRSVVFLRDRNRLVA